MTDASTSITQVDVQDRGASYVEWSAVFAGAILATAVFLLMTAFGSAIGLSMASPYLGPSPAIFYVALAIWFTWITVSSFAAGGYMTGRMRRPVDGASKHEIQIRDAAHGLIVWAVAVVLGVSLATFSLSSALRDSAQVLRASSSTIANVGGVQSDSMGYEVDLLLRSIDTSASKDAAGPRPDSDISRQEITRIVAAGAAAGSFTPDDHAYLSRVVSIRTGLSPADADKRVTAMTERMKAKAGADRAKTETARKIGVLLAFLTAAAIVLGAAAAWWGASVGGRHRDEDFDVTHLMRW